MHFLSFLVMYVHVCVHVCAHVWEGQRWMLDVLLHFCLPNMFWNSLIGWTDWPTTLGNLPHSSSVGIVTDAQHCFPHFHVGSGGLNSDVHACKYFIVCWVISLILCFIWKFVTAPLIFIMIIIQKGTDFDLERQRRHIGKAESLIYWAVRHWFSTFWTLWPF